MMRFAARVIRHLLRMGVVLAIVATGMMAWLGRPLVLAPCPALASCTATPGEQLALQKYGQRSLLHRFGLLIHGYWPAALLAVAALAGSMAILGIARPVRDRQLRDDGGFTRTFC
jgi:hypothetical protein